MTMTRLMIASYLSREIEGLTKREAAYLSEVIFDEIKLALVRRERVLLTGFGRFVTHAKKARTGRNPQTGAPITIDARTVVTFKPSPLLCRRVNRKTKAGAE